MKQKIIRNDGHFSVREYRDLPKEDLEELSKDMHTPVSELLNEAPEKRHEGKER